MAVIACVLAAFAITHTYAQNGQLDTQIAQAFDQEELMDLLAAEKIEAENKSSTLAGNTAPVAPTVDTTSLADSLPQLALGNDKDVAGPEFCVDKGIQYNIGEEWEEDCRTCLCQDILGRGELVCFPKKICGNMRCSKNERLVSRPEVDPCCDVCVRLKELCPDCPSSDTAASTAVCGSDGVTYPSVCYLEQNNCLSRSTIRVVSEAGGCDEVQSELQSATTANEDSADTNESSSTMLIVGIIILVVVVFVCCCMAAVVGLVLRRRRARKKAIKPRTSLYDSGYKFNSAVDSPSSFDMQSNVGLHGNIDITDNERSTSNVNESTTSTNFSTDGYASPAPSSHSGSQKVPVKKVVIRKKPSASTSS
eukprot:CFRG6498T1